MKNRKVVAKALKLVEEAGYEQALGYLDVRYDEYEPIRYKLTVSMCSASTDEVFGGRHCSTAKETLEELTQWLEDNPPAQGPCKPPVGTYHPDDPRSASER